MVYMRFDIFDGNYPPIGYMVFINNNLILYRVIYDSKLRGSSLYLYIQSIIIKGRLILHTVV